ncbi:MAG TPA: HEAT repeat domain-containing protein [Gammaproteobacteria bacterium]|nr:HEAT repeat domain-containing protein [Gammaproteobacteria bacterium]
MKKLSVLIGCLMASLTHNVFAEETKVDLYQTKQFTLAQIQPIIDEYRSKIKLVHQSAMKGNYKAGEKDILAFRKAIDTEVNKLGQYAYLKLDFVIYPKDPNNYLSINAVDKGLESTLPVYGPEPTGHYSDPAHLFSEWNKYQRVAMPLYMSGKVNSDFMKCKELHCIGEFGTPTLRKYEKEFSQKVPQHQVELIEILKNDSNSNKRATAVFLLAHAMNEPQLIDLMLGAMNDPDETVRANSVRVLSAIAMKDKNVTLPVDDFIKMLNSPILMDKSKALTVLFGLSQQPRYVEVIKEKAGPALMDCLRLNQPNLHNSAYLTLQSISGQLKNKSGQHYSDRDYAAWSHWLGLS